MVTIINPSDLQVFDRAAKLRTLIPGGRIVANGVNDLMATPATVSTQAGSFSGYTKLWPADNTANENWSGVANFYGGFMARSTNRVRPRSSTSNPTTATSPLAVTGFNDGISLAAFYTDEPAFAILVNTSNTLPFRVRINGQYVSLTGTQAFQTADSWMLVDASASGVAMPMHVEIEGPNSWGLSRIATRPTRSVWAPANTTAKIIVLGDSFVNGPLSGQYTSPSPIQHDGWVRVMAKALGCPDTWSSGLGGTGWATSSGTSPSLPNRAFDALNLMPDGVTARSSWAPDVIVATAGINDTAATNSQVADAVLSFYAYIRARNPVVPIIFGGVHWRPLSGVLSATQSREAAIRNAVSSLGDSRVGFVPISETAALQWVFGTGYEGATNSSGNTDTLTGVDGIHPSFDGHYQLGLRYALEVLRITS